jgi:hypothetical protein
MDTKMKIRNKPEARDNGKKLKNRSNKTAPQKCLVR